MPSLKIAEFLISEWHPTKNEFGMSEYSTGSSKKVWWVCEKGHEWQAVIQSRIKKKINNGVAEFTAGTGCPYCAGQKAGYGNSLADHYPNLVIEWHSENSLSPTECLPQSSKKFKWQCRQNNKHTWWASAQSRTKSASGCPFCSKQKVLPEESFATLNKKAYALWNEQKNNVDPYTLSSGSTAKKHWWKCLKNHKHEWQTTVSSIVNGTGCPFCAGKKVTKEESFGALYPDLVTSWDNDKNINSPFEFTPKSEKKVWWKCLDNPKHSWETTVAARANGGGCPFCSGRKVLPEESFGHLRPDLLKQLHPQKNGHIDPFKLTLGSSKMIWWQCPSDSGHVYEQTVYNRTSKGVSCPFCSGKRITFERSLTHVDPQMASEWHTIKNPGSTPETTFANSNKKFWWKCKTEPSHEWLTSPNSRRGNPPKGCPYCSNQMVDHTNSFERLHPNIAKDWHPEMNGKNKPTEFVEGSSKKIWWQCAKDKKHVWKTEIRNRVAGSNCPFCTRQTSSPEIRIFSELQEIFNIVENRKKIDGFEADILLPECSTIIEYDGAYWHADREDHDRRKNKFFDELGFNVIRVREKPLNPISDDDIIVSADKFEKLDINKIFGVLKTHCNATFRQKIEWYFEQDDFINEGLYKNYLSYFPSPFPENAISNTHPELSEEWDYDANFPLIPDNFTAGSHKKVWWICKNNSSHRWETNIKNRSKGRGCPYCSKHLPSEENNLAAIYPELLNFWHTTRNVGLSPEEISPHSNKRVWWCCPEGPDHEWEKSPNESVKNGKIQGCPFCANKRISITNNLNYLRPDLAKEWCWDRNENLTPEMVIPSSNKSVWWQCSNSNLHVWKARLAHRNNGSGCPYCSGRKKL